ncbi:hypothetical protein K456DRAFT_1176993 [Colletotrichum gloeosporioides 23]|nr:hypothetical protein K456DRAFT_1176993 [Colletotrichum gloeosporioides 23]
MGQVEIHFLRAFQEGYRDTTSMMLSSKADLSIFGNRLGGLFDCAGMSESQIFWKVDLLKSIGYSDWRIGNSVCTVDWGDSRFGSTWNNLNNLLYGATEVQQSDLTLFALEIAGIDPNQVGRLNRTPLGNAATRAWLEGVMILLYYGACINVNEGDWSGTPLYGSSQHGLLTDTSHYLLLQGADPKLKCFQGLSVLSYIMEKQYSPELFYYLRFAYIALEGSITHLLYHGSDPFEVLSTDYSERKYYEYPLSERWFDLLGPLQASDIARFKSYGVKRKGKSGWFGEALPKTFGEMINAMDESRDFDWRFEWNGCGVMSRVLKGSSEEQPPAVIEAPSVCGETHQQCFDADVSFDTEASLHRLDANAMDENTCVAMWEHINPEGSNWQNMASHQVTPGFFRNATAFYRHAATIEGQKHLSRWPMVRALCDGLQHAGYRVEMDDDGDLWYDCDDADRYVDAWETQPNEDRGNWLVDVCPICQNLNEYGLGHILEIEKETKDKIREYQRQANEGKRRVL